MQIIGNILLILATLAAGYLFNLNFLNKMPSGDAGVGHAWVSLFLVAIFWLCIALVALVLGSMGAFEGLALGRFSSTGMLILSFLVMLLGANLGLAGSSAFGLRYFALLSIVVTPVVLLVGFAILMNPNLKSAFSPSTLRWGFGAILALNSFLLGTSLLGMVVSRLGLFHLTRIFSNELDSNQLRIIGEIDSCDASKDIRSVFVFSGNNQHPKVQEKALAKIKSKPDWQNDLIQMLRSEWVDEAFIFLSSNEVDDKAAFAQPVYDGVLGLAKGMRQRLKRCSHPSHLYEGMFSTEVRRALEVVDKYQGLGIDYKPAVLELQAALDEPIYYDKPEFSCAKTLDKWLKRQSR